jgi:hypothetical protein
LLAASVAYWTFDSLSGGNWGDSTLNGFALNDPAGASSMVSGQIDGAASITTTGNNLGGLRQAYDAGFSPTTKFGFMARIKGKFVTDATECPLIGQSSFIPNDGWMITVDSGGNIIVYISTGSNFYVAAFTAQVLTDDTWAQLVVNVDLTATDVDIEVQNSKRIQIYLNNQRQAVFFSGPVPSTIIQNGQLLGIAINAQKICTYSHPLLMDDWYFGLNPYPIDYRIFHYNKAPT